MQGVQTEVLFGWMVSPSDIHYVAISAVRRFACHECSGLLDTKSSLFIFSYSIVLKMTQCLSHGHYTSQALSTPGREKAMPHCAHTADKGSRATMASAKSENTIPHQI